MKALCHACLLLALTLALGGCVKFKQVWSINPDGSGKMTLTFGFSEMALQQIPDGEDPFADLDNPEDMMNLEDQGWVAFTQPQISNEGGYKYATFTGYFEDINQVTFSGDGGNGDMQATQYALADGTFTVSNGMLSQVIASMTDDPQMNDPANKAFMLQMMAGMEFSESYDLPGTVTDPAGYTGDGEVAQTTVTIEELLGGASDKLDGLKNNEQAVVFTPAGWQGQQDAWNAELAAAKAEWAAMKNDAPVGAGTE